MLVVNTVSNRVVRLLGKDEVVRWLNLTLYQGAPAKKGVTTMVCPNTRLRPLPMLTASQAMAASANPILANKGVRDPTLFCTGYKKQRFYLFTRAEPE